MARVIISLFNSKPLTLILNYLEYYNIKSYVYLFLHIHVKELISQLKITFINRKHPLIKMFKMFNQT